MIFLPNRRVARVGNIGVDRNMIGAGVAAQHFGGDGPSGTGPETGPVIFRD